MRNANQILENKGRAIFSVSAETAVLDVIKLMAENHIGAVLVMRDDTLIGIASERDYARKVILQGRSSKDTPVSTIMSSPVLCVAPDDTAATCMSLMTQRHVRHLPVRDGDRIVGVISIGDLVKAVIEDQQNEIAQLQQYIAG